MTGFSLPRAEHSPERLQGGTAMLSGSRTVKRMSFVIILAGVGGFAAWAQQQNLGYQDTPMVPGQKWHVHDGTRPQPKVIDPGTASTQDMQGRPPSDAIVLFDGKDLSKWEGGNGKPAAWKVE